MFRRASSKIFSSYSSAWWNMILGRCPLSIFCSRGTLLWKSVELSNPELSLVLKPDFPTPTKWATLLIPPKWATRCLPPPKVSYWRMAPRPTQIWDESFQRLFKERFASRMEASGRMRSVCFAFYMKRLSIQNFQAELSSCSVCHGVLVGRSRGLYV